MTTGNRGRRSARATLLHALRRLPRGASASELRRLGAVLRGAAAEVEAFDEELRDELVRAFGATMAEKTPVTLEEALAIAEPAPGTSEEQNVRLAAELSRVFAPIRIDPTEAQAIERWRRELGPPPRRAALLRLAESLDELCRRAPLSDEDVERLRTLAAAADEERDEPEWAVIFKRLELLRTKLLGGEPPQRPLEASLRGRREPPRRAETLTELVRSR